MVTIRYHPLLKTFTVELLDGIRQSIHPHFFIGFLYHLYSTRVATRCSATGVRENSEMAERVRRITQYRMNETMLCSSTTRSTVPALHEHGICHCVVVELWR